MILLFGFSFEKDSTPKEGEAAVVKSTKPKGPKKPKKKKVRLFIVTYTSTVQHKINSTKMISVYMKNKQFQIFQKLHKNIEKISCGGSKKFKKKHFEHFEMISLFFEFFEKKKKTPKMRKNIKISAKN